MRNLGGVSFCCAESRQRMQRVARFHPNIWVLAAQVKERYRDLTYEMPNKAAAATARAKDGV